MSVTHRDEVREMRAGAIRLRGVRLSMCLEGAMSGSLVRCSSARYVPIVVLLEEMGGGVCASFRLIGVVAT